MNLKLQPFFAISAASFAGPDISEERHPDFVGRRPTDIATNCYKIFLSFLAFFSVSFNFLVFPKATSAQQQNSFVTIVNPVRGPEFFQGAPNPLETPKGQLEAISKNNLPATWLLRFDAYNNSEISTFFKTVPKNHELGIFFEITPSLTSAAGVTYNQCDTWHKAKCVFLTGYTLSDRKKLITTAFEEFRQVFGFYPKSVGAWWIDANSLTFMRERYGITANLTVADQFSTDDYQVWGMPYSTAFYPSKKNALTPAQSPENKIGIVSVQWAARDPFNGYGPGVQESTYSVQVNDYLSFHNLDFSYFEKLYQIYAQPNFFNQFGQLTIGLENTFLWEAYGPEYTRQIEHVAQKHLQGSTRAVTMNQFANWYSSAFGGISPPNLVFADDPLGGSGKVVWFNNENYRIGWFYHPTLYGSAIRDLRVYNDSLPEQCYATACSVITLAQTISKPLDEATFGNRWTIDEGQIADFKIETNLPADRQGDRIIISYKNAAGKPRQLDFAPKDLFIDGEGITVPAAILNVLQAAKDQGKTSLSLTEGRFGVNYVKLLTNFGLFIVFSLFLFTLTGIFFLNLTKIDFGFFTKFILGTILGLVVFVLVNFIFSWIRIPIFASLLLILLAIYQLFTLRKNFQIPKLSFNFRIFFLAVLILIGVSTQGLTVFKSGLLYDFGLGFWGPNGHDAIWHLAVAESLTKNFPPQNPILAGQDLRNYHYFYDFLLAKTNNLTQIPINDLYFRYFPIIISALFGLAVYVLVKDLTNSYGASLLAVLLSYFGGSLGWVVNFFREGNLGGESMFWAAQSVSAQLNPPFAISVVIFLAGLLLFYQLLHIEGVNLKHPRGVIGLHLWNPIFVLLMIAVLWGSLIQFKAYAGVLVLGSLGILAVWEFFVKRKIRILKLAIPTGLVTAIVFLPNNFGASNLLIFSPFWFVHTMAEYGDRLNWVRLANARVAYIQMGWWWKLALAEILGLAIFVIGNLGTRILVLGQIFSWAKSRFQVKPFQLFLVFFSAIAVVLPLLFIQKGTAWNTIQFFYYFQVIAGIFAAIFLWQAIKNWPNFGKIAAITILVLLTIPTTIGTALQYLPERPPARLPFGEFQALEFLRKQLDGIVLTQAYNKDNKDKFDLPLPLFAYETTAYVSAFSAKPTYVEDEINLEIIGADFENRVIGAKEFFRTRDENFQKEFLRKNNIKYIYITKFENFGPSEAALGIKKIFENDEVKIYQVI